MMFSGHASTVLSINYWIVTVAFVPHLNFQCSI